MDENNVPPVHWEVVDDTGTNRFINEKQAREYFGDALDYARDKANRYRGNLVLRQVTTLQAYNFV